MPYRRTENVVRKLAARHEAILQAARDLAAEGGMAAVQIAPVATRAGIAAGTVYRYFPSKIELVAALVEALSAAEMAALQRAGDAAPGPVSALAAEPVEPELDGARVGYRRALAGAIEARVRTALAAGHLPDQDVAVTAPALVGALIEGLIGPLAPRPAADAAAAARVQAQALTLLALRALGIVDARARGLVVQTRVRLDG